MIITIYIYLYIKVFFEYRFFHHVRGIGMGDDRYFRIWNVRISDLGAQFG